MVEFVSLESIKTEVDYSTPGWPYMANATRITSAKIVNAPAPLLRASSEQPERKIWYNIRCDGCHMLVPCQSTRPVM